MDATLVYLLAPFLPLLPVLLFRKRLVAWFSQQLAAGIVSWAFVRERVRDKESGKVVESLAVSAPAKALLASVAPVLLAEGMAWAKKNVKVGSLVQGAMPQLGADALGPAILGGLATKFASGKKITIEDILGGVAGVLLPRLGDAIGGIVAKPKAAEGTANPFLKELTP